MCGRFVAFRPLEELKRYLPIDRAACEPAPSYNVAPGQPVLAIVRQGGENVLDRYRWGLVPHWGRDPAVGSRMINARSETVAEKPSFRSAFRRRRCLVPAEGFFEWRTRPGGRQPVYITAPDGRPLAFAGLWESWSDRERPQEVLRTCTIITRQAVGPVAEVHHRMPVILSPEAYESWLDPENQDPAALKRLLAEAAVTELVYHPVSRRVNAVRNDGPANIEPLPETHDIEETNRK